MEMISWIGNMLGRLMLSAFFFICGIYQMIYWQEVEMYVNVALNRLQNLFSSSEIAQNFFSQIVFFLPPLLILGTGLTIVGSLLLILRVKEKLGAWLLLFFLIPQTIILNPFWMFDGNEREVAAAAFFRDLAIGGGLLLFLSTQQNRKEDSEEEFNSIKFQ